MIRLIPSKTARPVAVAALFGSLCLLAAAAQAQEWTRFRGPNGAGQSDATTIPTQWTEADINWKIALPGIGHSSPVLWGQKLFVGSADPSNGTRYLFCVNADDGQIVWQRDFPATAHHVHTQNSLASSTPACDEDHVYYAWGTPEEYTLLALDHGGEQVWRANLGKFTSSHGFGASPIVYEDLVIITNDQDGPSSVVAVDRKTGDVRWQIPRKSLSRQNASYSTPFLYTPADGKPELIINSWAHGVSSHNPRNGELYWEQAVFEKRPVGSPILVAGLIFGSGGDGAGTNTVVAVRPGDKQGRSPQVAYKLTTSTNNPYVPTMVAAGDLVFLWGDRGIVACLDAPTGKVHWRERVGGNYSSSPLRIGDRIFGISSDGEVVVLAASTKFEVLARNKLDDATRATPAVAHGRLYVRTQSGLMSVGGKK